jgi:ubiquinol-cytochrome c reductase cytochrome c subunit
VDRRATGGLAALVSLAALGWAAIAGPLAAPAVPAPLGAQLAAAGGVAQVTATDRGLQLYQASCAACHGVGGVGTPSGPAVADAGAALTDFMLRTGRMPAPRPGEVVRRAQPVFNDADIQAIVEYVASLGNGEPIPDVQVTAATDTAAGRAAYIATCAACHGAGASGDAVGGGTVAPPLLDTAPTQVGEAIRTGPGNMPAFDRNQVSDAQLSEIAAYLQFLRSRESSPGGAPLGGVGPVAEGYVGWIVYLVALLGVTRWIERRRRG